MPPSNTDMGRGPLLASLRPTLRPDDRDRLRPQDRASYARLSQRLMDAGRRHEEALRGVAWLAGVTPRTVLRWRRALDIDPGSTSERYVWATLVGGPQSDA